jgi:hypothetical protein
MPSYGQSITVCYRAFDQSAHAGKTGDAGNHTLRLVADGASSAPTNAPSEVDSANAPGIYKLVLTTAECQHNLVYLCGKSSTANVTIEPQQVTFEMLPTATPGAANGLMKLGANIGNTTFTGASLSQPGLSIDGLQMTNANWGSFPLFFNDILGTGTLGLTAAGSASVFTLISAGGHIFSMTPGTNKDVFHATLSGGLMFNPAANVIVSPGSGGDLVTISITDQTSGDPVAGARVWLTSDAPGHTVVAGTLTTDASGHATFLLTAGSTYYLWMTATGQNSIEGTPFVAVRD